MLFITNSYKFEISHFLFLFPKHMSFQDLILKVLSKNFSLSCYMAQGVRVLVQEDKLAMHGFFSQTLCIYILSTLRGSRKVSFTLSFLIFLQKRQKNSRTPAYSTELSQGGPFFWAHPVHNSTYLRLLKPNSLALRIFEHFDDWVHIHGQ